jgi:uncharacterized heparinase superfamily protein
VTHACKTLRGRLGLTLRTVRYLRSDQLVARLSFLLERRVVQVRPGLLARRYARQLVAVESETLAAVPIWRWRPAPFDLASRADRARAREIVQGRFTFLNQTYALPDPVDWSPPGTSRLWRFHLHSFSYAIDLAAAARYGEANAYDRLRSLVRQWQEKHVVDADDAWHPFVVSGRLIAWLVARDLLAPHLSRDPEFADNLRRRILAHALYLYEHLETDVGGNHLLKNAVALLLAGCAFVGPCPDRWRQRASRVLERELHRQVLPDGGHYERSPMYHLLVLADLLAALTASGRRDLPVAAVLADAVRRMQRAARTLVHPDGDIPLFNDAVLGEALAPSALVGPSTEPGAEAFPDMGYFLLPLSDPTPGGLLIADCGPPGPDDLPAHMHADALSFELSVGNQRVLVDGGVLDYEPGKMRDHLRGTAAHNTVEVDRRDQSEVWSAFRVGRRARVTLERWSVDGEARHLVGAHNGYAHLGVRHQREVQAVPGSGWRVLDTLLGSGHHTADSRLRLHPDLTWQADGADYRAVDGRGVALLRVRPIGQPAITIERGVYAERFNTRREVEVLRLRRDGPLPVLFGYWLLLPGGEPAVV